MLLPAWVGMTSRSFFLFVSSPTCSEVCTRCANTSGWLLFLFLLFLDVFCHFLSSLSRPLLLPPSPRHSPASHGMNHCAALPLSLLSFSPLPCSPCRVMPSSFPAFQLPSLPCPLGLSAASPKTQNAACSSNRTPGAPSRPHRPKHVKKAQPGASCNMGKQDRSCLAFYITT